MMHCTDVVIVGGGIIGNVIAYYLRASQVAVTIIEEYEVGQQASSAAAGLLAPLGPLSGPGPFADLLLASFTRFPALLKEITEGNERSLAYEATGALRVVRATHRLKYLQKRFRSWQPLGLTLEWLSGEQACMREPQLTPELQAAIFAPQEAQINAIALTNTLARRARERGAICITHDRVQHLETSQHRVTAVWTASGQRIACQTVVIASGVWSPLCVQELGLHIPVKPQHGQIIQIQQPEQPVQYIIFGDGIYIVPRGKSLLVGATKEDQGFTVQVTEVGIQWLRESAQRLIPALKDRSVEHAWAGLRPKTPDGYPLLGSVGPWQNVILATGHNSVGILLSPITGESIAELIVHGRMTPLIEPFTPMRFDLTH